MTLTLSPTASCPSLDARRCSARPCALNGVAQSRFFSASQRVCCVRKRSRRKVTFAHAQRKILAKNIHVRRQLSRSKLRAARSCVREKCAHFVLTSSLQRVYDQCGADARASQSCGRRPGHTARRLPLAEGPAPHDARSLDRTPCSLRSSGQFDHPRRSKHEVGSFRYSGRGTRLATECPRKASPLAGDAPATRRDGYAGPRSRFLGAP